MGVLNKDNIPNIDFSNMNFNKIKNYVDVLKEQYCNYSLRFDKLCDVGETLKKDNRKNVQSLGNKIVTFLKARNKEINRVKGMYEFDKKYLNKGYIAGVDEVGRGPLAGPIVAASVVLDLESLEDKNLILGIKDSKKLPQKTREELSELIKSKAVSYNISQIDNYDIDDKGIAWCNNMVFKIAVSELKIKPDFVICDGYPIKNFDIKNDYLIKGDEKSASIACASIIAKVYRDNLMKEYAKTYPYYGFDANAGYGTKEHIEAIKEYGPCDIHRMCFLNNIILNAKN